MGDKELYEAIQELHHLSEEKDQIIDELIAIIKQLSLENEMLRASQNEY